MNIPTPEQIAKLPKWAQEYVSSLERRTIVAERTLNGYLDNQTPSKFFTDDLICIGEGSPQAKRRFIQAYHISMIHAGVRLDVLESAGHLFLQWFDENRLGCDIAMVPESFNRVRLVSKENMR